MYGVALNPELYGFNDDLCAREMKIVTFFIHSSSIVESFVAVVVVIVIIQQK